MRGERTSEPAMHADPGATRIVDVLVVLLIVVLVLVPLRRRSADVELEVGPGGELALDRQPVAEAELGARLRAIHARRPGGVVVVRVVGLDTHRAPPLQ